MLEPVMSVLSNQRIILASSSPRRQEILRNAGLKFDVIPSLYDENLDPGDFSTPSAFVKAIAVNKVDDVQKRLISAGEKYDLIIGADTVVSKNNKIYGKPKDKQEAFSMLKSFSGSSHVVYTGVCLRNNERDVTFSEMTEVFFGELSDEVLRTYVETGDSLDKAGGYGIQVKGGTFIRRIEGDYYNVVGLPLYEFCKNLSELCTMR